MAKRVLKDWTASEKMDSVSIGAEVFFTRLIMKADDFGSFYANPKLLKAALFPLKEIRYDEIGALVHECIEAGLVFLYEADGREYIRIKDFGQRLRNMRNAFPHPQQIAADRGVCPPEEKRNETEREPAAAPICENGNVPRGRFEIDSYSTAQEAFEEIKNDERQVETLLMAVRRSGYNACDEITLMKAVRHFVTVESAKPDFSNRPRDDLKKHLVNWVRLKAKTLNQYG